MLGKFCFATESFTFEITDENSCQEIQIVDDFTLNTTDTRNIEVILTSSSPSLVVVPDPDVGYMSVVDNDSKYLYTIEAKFYCEFISYTVVDISFEHKNYTFNETDGDAMLCAIVVNNNSSCPIDSNQFISISTRSFQAGMIASKA